MEYERFTLPNGLRIIHHRTSGSPVSHCGIVLNVGSRDERAHESGMAHYIEHCLFKGTSRRKAFHILNRLDAVGGEINAYTAKEETCIYGSFLNEHYERAVELIQDITFGSTFPQKEIDKEKDVILDEINAYLDTPSEQIFDDFEAQVYQGHTIGRSILGSADSLTSFTRKHVTDFVERNYDPARAVFSSAGDIPFSKVKRLAEKYFSDLQPGNGRDERIPFDAYQPTRVEQQHDVFQAHEIIGSLAYPVSHPRRAHLSLLNNTLGGPGMNSRLNLNIREKYGFAYNIESNYTPYSDTGVLSVYLGTDPSSLDRTRQLVLKELKKLREKKLGAVQLHSAKQQLMGQIALGRESKANVMLSIGKSTLMLDEVYTLPQIRERLDKITAEELLEVSNEVFAEDQLSTLTFQSSRKS